MDPYQILYHNLLEENEKLTKEIKKLQNDRQNIIYKNLIADGFVIVIENKLKVKKFKIKIPDYEKYKKIQDKINEYIGIYHSNYNDKGIINILNNKKNDILNIKFNSNNKKIHIDIENILNEFIDSRKDNRKNIHHKKNKKNIERFIQQQKKKLKKVYKDIKIERSVTEYNEFLDIIKKEPYRYNEIFNNDFSRENFDDIKKYKNSRNDDMHNKNRNIFNTILEMEKKSFFQKKSFMYILKEYKSILRKQRGGKRKKNS
jgi:hypothetical protein